MADSYLAVMLTYAGAEKWKMGHSDAWNPENDLGPSAPRGEDFPTLCRCPSSPLIYGVCRFNGSFSRRVKQIWTGLFAIFWPKYLAQPSHNQKGVFNPSAPTRLEPISIRNPRVSGRPSQSYGHYARGLRAVSQHQSAPSHEDLIAPAR